MTEENQKGWTEFFAYSDARSRGRLGANGMTFGDEMLILSEDIGFFNLYWMDTKPGGKGRKAITQHRFDVVSIVKVDDAGKRIFYTAGDGETPYRHQLHVINFDGTGHKSLTDPQFHHSVTLSSDNKYFVDDFENAKNPPSIQVVNVATGKATPVAQVADLGVKQVLSLSSGSTSRAWMNQRTCGEPLTSRVTSTRTRSTRFSSQSMAVRLARSVHQAKVIATVPPRPALAS
ncbi:MAG: DPP IV N-terminal domain-containing protein [Fimbriimonadaceae bacterium]